MSSSRKYLFKCCSNTKFHNSKTFEKIFTTGRHYFLSCIITSQYITHIPPSARVNSEFILVSNLNNNNVQILADEYTLGNCDRKKFINIYKQSIPNHGFLYILLVRALLHIFHQYYYVL